MSFSLNMWDMGTGGELREGEEGRGWEEMGKVRGGVWNSPIVCIIISV